MKILDKLPMLEGIVDAIWLHRPGESFNHGPHRVLPDGAVDIIATLWEEPGGIELLGLNLFGVREGYDLVSLDPHLTLLGMRFYLGKAASCLNLPVDECSGLTLALHDLGRNIFHPFRQAFNAKTLPQLTLSLQKACLARQEAIPVAHGQGLMAAQHLIDRIVDTQGRLPLEQLAGELRISERHARRHVEKLTGLSPKRLARILRFQAAHQQLAAGKADSLADLALRFDFADQAHMSREFMALSGLSPRQILRR